MKRKSHSEWEEEKKRLLAQIEREEESRKDTRHKSNSVDDELKKHEEQCREIAGSLMLAHQQWKNVVTCIEQIDQLARSTRENLQAQEKQLSQLHGKEQMLVKSAEEIKQKRAETEKQTPQIESAIARLLSTTTELKQQREEQQRSDDELRSAVRQLQERRVQLQRIVSNEALQQLLSALQTLEQPSYPFESRG